MARRQSMSGGRQQLLHRLGYRETDAHPANERNFEKNHVL
jgi:hypothetical protein